MVECRWSEVVVVVRVVLMSKMTSIERGFRRRIACDTRDLCAKRPRLSVFRA